jgi:hypothetical protein
LGIIVIFPKFYHPGIWRVAMASTYCPECDTQISMSKTAREGDSITCKSCGAYLKVINIDPFELDWEDFEEELDDDDFELDDDW